MFYIVFKRDFESILRLNVIFFFLYVITRKLQKHSWCVVNCSSSMPNQTVEVWGTIELSASIPLVSGHPNTL